MKRRLRIFVLAVVFSLLIGCSSEPEPEPEPTAVPSPEVSDLFKSQSLKFIEEASKLKSMTKQGINFSEYSEQLTEVEGVYELLDSLWVEDFEVETQENIEKALEGWEWAKFLWGQRIEHYLCHISNDVDTREYFDQIYDYAGDDLDISTGQFMIENEATGEEELIQWLPYDENIAILFSVANDYFDKAQTVLLQIIQ